MAIDRANFTEVSLVYHPGGYHSRRPVCWIILNLGLNPNEEDQNACASLFEAVERLQHNAVLVHLNETRGKGDTDVS